MLLSTERRKKQGCRQLVFLLPFYITRHAMSDETELALFLPRRLHY